MDRSAASRPDVTVAIVSFNTRDLLGACLRSLAGIDGCRLETVVVDNHSSDGSACMVEAEFPDVSVIRLSRNQGFAAATNLVLAGAQGRHVLLLNPDTEVPPNALSTMVAFLDAHADVGICGPRLMRPDGTLQSCGLRFPTLLWEIRQSKRIDRLLRFGFGPPPSDDIGNEPREVEWVDGACLMARREIVERIGPLDEQYFMFAEELDWCYNARKAGWKVFALPHVIVVHHQGQSTAQRPDESLSDLIETRLRYYRKNRSLVVALAASLVFVAGCLKQFPGQRRKQVAKLRGIGRWWRAQLPGGR